MIGPRRQGPGGRKSRYFLGVIAAGMTIRVGGGVKKWHKALENG